MAHLALSGCSHANGVSRLHGRVSRIFQSRFVRWPEDEVLVGYVTNGVHIPTWDSPVAQKLWTDACPGDRGPEGIDYWKEGIRAKSDEELWCFKQKPAGISLSMSAAETIGSMKRGAGLEELKIAGHVLSPNISLWALPDGQRPTNAPICCSKILEG